LGGKNLTAPRIREEEEVGVLEQGEIGEKKESPGTREVPGGLIHSLRGLSEGARGTKESKGGEERDDKNKSLMRSHGKGWGTTFEKKTNRGKSSSN